VGVASHVSTHEAGSLAAAAGVQRAQIARLDLVVDAVVRERPLRSLAAHMMSIPIGENNDISRVELEGFPVRHFNNGTPVDHKMVEQKMDSAGSERTGH
jgi:hypothetical protein